MEDKKSFKINCNVQKNDTTLKQNETSIINRLISLRNSIKPFYHSKQPDLILMKNLIVIFELKLEKKLIVLKTEVLSFGSKANEL